MNNSMVDWSSPQSLSAATPNNNHTVQSPKSDCIHPFTHPSRSVIVGPGSVESQRNYTPNHVNHHPSVLVPNTQQQQGQITQIPPYHQQSSVIASVAENTNTSASGTSEYGGYYSAQSQGSASSALQSPQDGSNFFFPPASSFSSYGNLGSPAAWPYCAFPYTTDLDQYHYNQPGSLTDLLAPIHSHFDMPTSRAGMVVQNYGGTYTMASNKKRTGGRRPKEEEEQLSSEEKEKRFMRRKRNKEAAARCRQRRLDHMQQLQNQVDALAAENREKQNEIDALTQEKEELSHALANHQCFMKQNGGTKPQHTFMAPTRTRPFHVQAKSHTPPVKVEPLDPTLTQVMTCSETEGYNTLSASVLSRPSSLPFDTPNTPGVPIQTPSAGFGGFDLLGQSTGLTPVTNTGLTPILTLGALATSGHNLSLETPTGMDTTPSMRIATTLHNL